MNEMEWWNDIEPEINQCMNDRRHSCKPNVASVLLDNTSKIHQMQYSMQSNIDSHPINLLDTEKVILPNQPIEPPPPPSKEIDSYGEILLDDTIDIAPCEDPVIQSLKASQELLNQAWSPNLNTISEESIYDIRIANKNLLSCTPHMSAVNAIVAESVKLTNSSFSMTIKLLKLSVKMVSTKHHWQ